MYNDKEIFNKILIANEELAKVTHLKSRILKGDKNWSGWDKENDNKGLVVYYNPKIKQIKENSYTYFFSSLLWLLMWQVNV